MATLASLQKVFEAADASEMLVATMDSNFHWEEQFHAPFGSSGNFLSFAMVCRSFEPLEPFFSEEREPDASAMYALYLMCKKFAAHFFLPEGEAEKVRIGKEGVLVQIPLAAAYRTMDRKRPRRRQLTAAEQLALEQMMGGLDDFAAGYSRVHITLVERDREDDLCEGSSRTRRRMECFTLEKAVLEEVARRTWQEALDVEKMQAFCMGLHARLGEQSLIQKHLDEDIGRLICCFYAEEAGK